MVVSESAAGRWTWDLDNDPRLTPKYGNGRAGQDHPPTGTPEAIVR